MTHFETSRRTRLIAKVGAAAVIAVVSSALLALPQTVRVRAAADENVKVVNTAASAIPVAVQGSLAVGGTVQSQQSGPWNVGIAGTPTFVVANNPGVPLLVRDVDSPARHGYQASSNVLIDIFDGTASFMVPAGQLAVIQHVSANGATDTGSIVRALVTCNNNFEGQRVTHPLILTSQGDITSQGRTLYAASQPISCIASGGDSSNPALSVHVFAQAILSGVQLWQVSVSGYLVTP